MLSSHLRFVFQFIFINYYIFNFLQADNSSVRNQCQSGWHYLSDQSTCIIFATSQAGDVSWYDGYKACRTSSSQLLILSESMELPSIERMMIQLEQTNEFFSDYIQRGAWIGKAKWSNDDLCDSTSITIEDLQMNCIILTIRTANQGLCLKRVSCTENHPFICQNQPMTESELVENTMERISWWKCLILVIWCVVDHAAEEKKKKEAEAAAAASLQAFIDQFNFDIPSDLELSGNAQALITPNDDKLVISGFEVSNWMIITAGGLIFVLVICLCCTVMICIVVKLKRGRSRQNPANRDGSFDSTYSTVSR